MGERQVKGAQGDVAILARIPLGWFGAIGLGAVRGQVQLGEVGEVGDHDGLIAGSLGSCSTVAGQSGLVRSVTLVNTLGGAQSQALCF